jgi:hypothetical protein
VEEEEEEEEDKKSISCEGDMAPHVRRRIHGASCEEEDTWRLMKRK